MHYGLIRCWFKHGLIRCKEYMVRVLDDYIGVLDDYYIYFDYLKIIHKIHFSKYEFTQINMITFLVSC